MHNSQQSSFYECTNIWESRNCVLVDCNVQPSYLSPSHLFPILLVFSQDRQPVWPHVSFWASLPTISLTPYSWTRYLVPLTPRSSKEKQDTEEGVSNLDIERDVILDEILNYFWRNSSTRQNFLNFYSKRKIINSSWILSAARNTRLKSQNWKPESLGNNIIS